MKIYRVDETIVAETSCDIERAAFDDFLETVIYDAIEGVLETLESLGFHDAAQAIRNTADND